MFNLPSGILTIIIAMGLPAVRKRWLGWYAACGALILTLHQWLLVPGGSILMNYAGYEIQPYLYREGAHLAGRFLTLFTLVYFTYLLDRRKGRLFYLLSLLHLAAGLSLLYTNDFLSFFIFWESLTLTAVLLILGERRLKQVKLYFLFQMAGAVALMTGIGITYSATGSLNISSAAAAPAYGAYPFFLLAAAIKTGAMPLHLWLVETYSGISRKLALFLAATTTKVGAFGIVLLVPELNLEVAGGLLAVVAVLYSFRQTQIRRFLSFHLIGRIGFIAAGVGSPNPIAVTGGLYQIANSMIYMGLLFMVADSILPAVCDEDFTLGPGRNRPLPGAAAGIAAASVAGLPPLNGFIGKALIKEGLGGGPAALILEVAGLLTALSLVRFIHLCFLRGERPQRQTPRGGGRQPVNGEGMRPVSLRGVAILALTGFCLFMGLAPGLFLGGLPSTGFAYYDPPGVAKALIPVLLAFLIYILGYDRMHPTLVRFTPEATGLAPRMRGIVGRGLDTLVGLHSGRLRHYLIWTFSLLGFLWVFLLLLS